MSSNRDNVCHRPMTTSHPPVPEYDLEHFIATGQSLAIGAQGAPALATPLQRTLMYDTGIRALGKQPQALVDAFEAEVETCLSGFAHWLGRLRPVSRPAHRTIVSAVGVGGEEIANLQRDTPPYRDIVEQVRWARAEAQRRGLTYRVSALALMQGEADALLGTGLVGYRAQVALLQRTLEADLQAVTGVTRPIPMFLYQTASHGRYAGTALHPSVEIPLAHWQEARDNPNLHLVAPMYPFPYADGLHLTNHGYRWYGHYLAKSIAHWLTTGEKWRPLEPTRARQRDSVRVGVDFHVPVPPLRFDTSLVRQLDDGMNGFELYDQTGRVPISHTRIVDGTQVELVAARALSGAVTVGYGLTPVNQMNCDDTGRFLAWNAGPASGVRGTLCDSDRSASDLSDMHGNRYALANYCVIFRLPCD
ncbi:sialate O-acetylesterase [Paraburkholderia sp. Cy-641]|nr:sialate O-acetylesterase [Paraburkholderia sp. Cy-641]